MSTMLYLYGFTPTSTALPEDGLAGIADTVVELMPLDGFAAAISRVASADFTTEALEARTRDIAWVGEHAVAHERVVAWFVDHAQVLPVPLFTLFSSDAALQADAAGRASSIAAALKEFAGLREWDLKVAYREAELRAHAAQLSPDVAELERQIAESTPGKRFLLERKRDDLLTREVRRAARQLADELLETAADSAVRTRRLATTQDAEVGAGVLNAALLLGAEAEGPLRERLAARAEELRALGLAVTYSGPWAPYRFLAPEPSLA